MGEMAERRQWKRYPITYPIEIDAGEKHANRMFIARDVSSGGAAFAASEKAKKNAKINLRIFLKKRMFVLEAIIVHVRQLQENLYSIGVKFQNVPEDFHPALEREAEEITQTHRQRNLYDRKNISFTRAAEEYLAGATRTEE